LKQRFQHNFCYFSNDNVFSTNFYVLTHLCLFEWKISFKCFSWNHMNEILHIKLKWDNEIICNIWLSTSWSLVIVWMVFEIYLHFAVYHDDDHFCTNIIFNHLTSISKWIFFLQSYFLDFVSYSKYHLQENLLILAC